MQKCGRKAIHVLTSATYSPNSEKVGVTLEYQECEVK